MRTFGSTLAVVLSAATLLAPSELPAQRNARRVTTATRAPEHPTTPRKAVDARANSSATRCTSGCGDYSLAIVSAVMPSETAPAASDVVTLVIENRGTIDAPVSIVSVAPRNNLTLARRTAIPILAPGQRTTITLPVETAPDGTQCVSITISPAPAADPVTARFLAAAIPDPHVGAARFSELASSGVLANVAPVERADPFANFRTLGDW